MEDGLLKIIICSTPSSWNTSAILWEFGIISISIPMLSFFPFFGFRMTLSYSGDILIISPKSFSMIRSSFLWLIMSFIIANTLQPLSLMNSRHAMLRTSFFVCKLIFNYFIKLVKNALMLTRTQELRQSNSSIYSPTFTIGEGRQIMISLFDFFEI